MKGAINKLRRIVQGHEAYGRRLGVKIGKGGRIYSSNFGSEPFLVEIGDRVTVSFGVIFLTHDGASWLIRDERGRRYIYRPVKIGNDCFIGAGAIIMPGVTVGDRSIIGAGTVLTKSVPPGSIVAGNPGRLIGTTDDFGRRIAHLPSDQDLAGIEDFRQRVIKAIDPAPRKSL